MPYSMTGYGRAELSADGRVWEAEIHSVNSRYFEFQLRSSRSLQRFEAAWRSLVREGVSRGKIELRVSLTDSGTSVGDVVLDEGRARSYAAARRRLAALLSAESGQEMRSDDPGMLAWLSQKDDVMTFQENDALEEQLQNEAMALVRQAIASFNGMREQEAKHLCADLLHRLDGLEALRTQVGALAETVPLRYRERLELRVEELLGEQVPEYYNGQRVAAEIALFADRADVREELVRLHSHFAQAEDLLKKTAGPIGKKLDFLVQEMNRETNTIGSKANDLEITQLVVEMKTGIEQFREQIQNLE